MEHAEEYQKIMRAQRVWDDAVNAFNAKQFAPLDFGYNRITDPKNWPQIIETLDNETLAQISTSMLWIVPLRKLVNDEIIERKLLGK